MLLPQQRLLYCDASQLSAWRWQGGRLRAEGRYAHDEDGLAALGAYLARHRSSVFRLLADVAEEGFQFESVPYVRGADRSALLQRKLNQFFYGTPLAVALSHGRESGGRRDERVLFAALTRAQMIEPWLAALRQAQVQFAGLWSLPLLAPALAQQMRWTGDACLLVSMTPAGVRQTYLEAGRLRFSRLSPLPEGGGEEIARICASEAARTYQYLAGQRVIVRRDPLPVLVLAPRAWHPMLAATCQDSEDLRFLMVDLAETAKRCDLREVPQHAGSEALFLCLLARRAPREQFAPAPERRFYRLWQMRFGLTAAGATAMFAALLFAANELMEVHDLRQATQALRAQAERDRQRYEGILAGLPAMPTSVDNLRAVIDRYDAMNARSDGPAAMLLRISRALDAFPDIELTRIDWQLGTDAVVQRNGGEARGGQVLAVAVLVATLPPAQAGEQRLLIETVDAFVAALRNEGGLQTTVLQMPVDVESGQTLRGGAGTATAAAPPRFSLRLSYPLGAAS